MAPPVGPDDPTRPGAAHATPAVPTDEEPRTVKTTVETLDPVKVKLTVEVEPKRVKKAFDAAARELAKQVTIPGFRPGKAPRRLIEQRIGQGAIAQQAMENSLSTYYSEAVQAEELAPVGQPEVDIESFTEADGCTFTATVEVRPSVDLPDHTGVAVEFPAWDVDDARIDEQLEQMRERFAEVEVVERAAADGDLITIDLDVEVDGEALDGAHVEDALYEIGSGGVTPKLDTEAIGKSAGDTIEYTDALPDEYPEHGGKDATFKVTVKDVRVKELPDLDDDFATTASEFDTIQELRADLRNALLRRSIQQAQHDLRGTILDRYLDGIEVPLPPAMVDGEVDQKVHQLEHQASQFGADLDDLLAMQDTDLETFKTEAREAAESSVKAQIVLDELSSKLELPIEPSDIDAEIVRHAQANDVSPQQIAQIVQQQGTLGALIGDIMRRKTIDAIVAAADISGAPGDEVLADAGLERVDGVIREQQPQMVEVPADQTVQPEGATAAADQVEAAPAPEAAEVEATAPEPVEGSQDEADDAEAKADDAS